MRTLALAVTIACVSTALLSTACTSNTTAPPAGGGNAPPVTTPAPPDTEPPAGSTSGGTTPPPPSTPGPLNPKWGAKSCPAAAAGVGFAVGESIGDLKVKDCDTGAEATIDDLCGADATWIFAAHTHCPTCQATAGFTDDVAAAVADKNVAIAQLVYDDNGTSCAKWRTAYKLAGLTNVRVYADPGGAAFAKLKTTNYTAPSAFLDKHRVVTYKEHGMTKADVLAQITSALAKP